eukprot:765440-Hanusia_phi.AAC.7
MREEDEVGWIKDEGGDVHMAGRERGDPPTTRMRLQLLASPPSVSPPQAPPARCTCRRMDLDPCTSCLASPSSFLLPPASSPPPLLLFPLAHPPASLVVSYSPRVISSANLHHCSRTEVDQLQENQKQREEQEGKGGERGGRERRERGEGGREGGRERGRERGREGGREGGRERGREGEGGRETGGLTSPCTVTW